MTLNKQSRRDCSQKNNAVVNEILELLPKLTFTLLLPYPPVSEYTFDLSSLSVSSPPKGTWNFSIKGTLLNSYGIKK